MELRQSIRKHFVPCAEARGFIADPKAGSTFFLTFRRIKDDQVHVFDIQFDKRSRPRFIVNFGTCSSEGVVFAGERIAACDVSTAHMPVSGRLAPKQGASTRHWFRQDKPLFYKLLGRHPLYSSEQVVHQLIHLFDELDLYWMTGVAGPHLRIFKLPFRR